MPRRNQREKHAEYPPLDLTPPPTVLFAPRTRRQADKPGPRPYWAEPYENPQARLEREGAERQTEARKHDGIDWSVCLVPGCGRVLAPMISGAATNQYMRDPEKALPLCKDHAVIVWQQVQRFRTLPDIMETAEQLSARHRREAARLRPRAVDQPDDGELYFVRINDLVKVGWTATLERRLKEYGAGAELLCHFPGTRAEETLLHRKLNAVRAKGREWYHDGDVIQRHVTNALEQHGPPTAKADWTVPKNPVTVRQAG